ncbi:MAG TPA: Hpt domain-containing protein [Hyphomicrobiales bacterium]|nr:Hpt domain-containing protein [Hyphomicrobiales bacterium]
MQNELRVLIERHCTTIRQYTDLIGGYLEEGLCDFPASYRALIEAEKIAHQLKGSSGSIGFADVSAAATRLDEQLKILCGEENHLSQHEREKTAGLFQVLAEVSRTLTPNQSSLLHRTAQWQRLDRPEN